MSAFRVCPYRECELRNDHEGAHRKADGSYFTVDGSPHWRRDAAVDLSVAVKADDGKIRLELLPTAALEEIGKVLTIGARKYHDFNWAKGFAWSRLIGAGLRHFFAFIRGEDRDPETGELHLAHLGCCVLFMLEHALKGLGTDDRWKGAKP